MSDNAAHVEALWWLLTTKGHNKSFYQPGDKGTALAAAHTDYKIVLAHPETSTVRTLQADTREELLDKVVAVMVEEKLTAPAPKAGVTAEGYGGGGGWNTVVTGGGGGGGNTVVAAGGGGGNTVRIQY
jgi:hypothetical protein